MTIDACITTDTNHTYLNDILSRLGGKKIGTVHCFETSRRWLWGGGNAQEGGRADGRGGSFQHGTPIRSSRLGEGGGGALRSGWLKGKRGGGRRGGDEGREDAHLGVAKSWWWMSS